MYFGNLTDIHINFYKLKNVVVLNAPRTGDRNVNLNLKDITVKSVLMV